MVLARRVKNCSCVLNFGDAVAGKLYLYWISYALRFIGILIRPSVAMLAELNCVSAPPSKAMEVVTVVADGMKLT